MNNKEFITRISTEMGITAKEATLLMDSLVNEMTFQLEEENMISLSGFGMFELKKKLERVVVNPATKQRMLVPPKLVINFKPTSSLKEKANTK